MSWLFSIFMLVFSCCFSRPSIMTKSTFDNVQVGDPVVEVQKKAGEPYRTRKLGDGTEEYEYIERIPLGEETVQENRYYLIIKNGQVVGKKYKEDLPPAFDQIYDPNPNDTDLQ